MGEQRQKVLVLYLANSALDSAVVGWSIYDGTGREAHTTGDGDTPPYQTGLDALRDGWRLLQISQLIPPYPGAMHRTISTSRSVFCVSSTTGQASKHQPLDEA